MRSNQQFPNVIFRASLRPQSAGLATILMLFLVILTAQPAQAQTYKVLYNFTGGADGSKPETGLTWDSAGNLYGTTRSGGLTGSNCGGDYGCGTVFKLTYARSGWTFSTINSFAGGLDGDTPTGRVVFGPDGSLYGTTEYGGLRSGGGACNWGNLTGCGTVFSLGQTTYATGWNKTSLYRFAFGLSSLTAHDGANPNGDLIFDQEGNIYGTTTAGGGCGGLGCGTVYELMPVHGGWHESVLYAFGTGGYGGVPDGGVVFDSVGNLYGTTEAGGQYGGGTVLQLVPTGSGWTANVIYAFRGLSDGESPQAGLIIDASGNLYGTTEWGRGGDSASTVFELSPAAGGWTYHLLYTFTDAGGPSARLAMDAAGNLYGTTRVAGVYGHGNVFELVRSLGWSYRSLHDFTGGSDGGYSGADIIFDGFGNIYGTTQLGGSGDCYGVGCGVVFEITP